MGWETGFSPILQMNESKNDLQIDVVSYEQAKVAIQSVRYEVFQIEQNVAPELEFDREDDTATHLVAYWQGNPVGTTRIRQVGDRTCKIERVAVLTSHRGLGIGRELMDVAIAHLQDNGTTRIKINAQTHAQSFYERLGFVQRGEPFDEAGILHIEMWKQL